MVRDPISQNFDKAWIVDERTGCHLWQRAKTTRGYGKLAVNGKLVAAHRFAYIRANGDIPEDLVVMHKCDVRNCVNPEHLTIGTQQQNVEDMCSKGRQKTKLSPQKVCEIRLRLANGERPYLLAKEYGVRHSLICYVARGEIWQEVA